MSEKTNPMDADISSTPVTVPDKMPEITKKIQRESRKLLEEQKVDVVIGFEPGWADEVVTPCFLTEVSQADKLVFDERCSHNLAKYLVGSEGYLTSHFRGEDQKPRVALVARPAIMRTIAGLIQEHQFNREDVTVLGIVDGTLAGIEPDILVGQIEEDREERERLAVELQKLEEMSVSERQSWWDQQFSKCIRCYACRQVCPFCYCEQCIVDENQPQWIEKSFSPQNNVSWNIIRAFHLVGRCTSCGECERACPMKIPLMLLNATMVDKVQKTFDYVAGTDMEKKLDFAAFQLADSGDSSGGGE